MERFNVDGLISRPSSGCSGKFGLDIMDVEDIEPFGCHGYFGVAYAIMGEACSHWIHAWGT